MVGTLGAAYIPPVVNIAAQRQNSSGANGVQQAGTSVRDLSNGLRRTELRPLLFVAPCWEGAYVVLSSSLQQNRPWQSGPGGLSLAQACGDANPVSTRAGSFVQACCFGRPDSVRVPWMHPSLDVEVWKRKLASLFWFHTCRGVTLTRAKACVAAVYGRARWPVSCSVVWV